MPKRIEPKDHALTFLKTAPEAELRGFIDTAKLIADVRFPRSAEQPKRGRPQKKVASRL